MITILTPHFPPFYEYGGPNKSLTGVCTWLTQEGIAYQVLSKMPKVPKEQPKVEVINSNIFFKKRIGLSELIKNFKQTDVIWINTLYSYSFSVLPLIALLMVRNKTVLISPRGQLLAGALNSKKRLYLRVFKLLLKRSGHKIWVHYSNKDEQRKSHSIFKSYRSILFNNAISGKIAAKAITKPESNNFVLGYFGRISAIKNIEFIFTLLGELPNNVVLEIHGSILNSKYQNHLEQLVEELNISSRVTFCESYNTSTFAQKSKGVDLVLIPSLSESFCHVFFEVIEVKKLVLGSTGLPWEGVNALVENTILPLKSELWIARIEQIINFTPSQYSQEQDKLVRYYNQIYTSAKQDTIFAIKQILQEL